MPKIKIPQKNLTIHVEDGANLMSSLLLNQLPVASSCDGEGVCSMCKVKVTGTLSPAEQNELDTLARNKCEGDERLSCQISVTSDVTVTTKYW